MTQSKLQLFNQETGSSPTSVGAADVLNCSIRHGLSRILKVENHLLECQINHPWFHLILLVLVHRLVARDDTLVAARESEHKQMSRGDSAASAGEDNLRGAAFIAMQRPVDDLQRQARLDAIILRVIDAITSYDRAELISGSWRAEILAVLGSCFTAAARTAHSRHCPAASWLIGRIKLACTCRALRQSLQSCPELWSVASFGPAMDTGAITFYDRQLMQNASRHWSHLDYRRRFIDMAEFMLRSSSVSLAAAHVTLRCAIHAPCCNTVELSSAMRRLLAASRSLQLEPFEPQYLALGIGPDHADSIHLIAMSSASQLGWFQFTEAICSPAPSLVCFKIFHSLFFSVNINQFILPTNFLDSQSGLLATVILRGVDIPRPVSGSSTIPALSGVRTFDYEPGSLSVDQALLSDRFQLMPQLENLGLAASSLRVVALQLVPIHDLEAAETVEDGHRDLINVFIRMSVSRLHIDILGSESVNSPRDLSVGHRVAFAGILSSGSTFRPTKIVNIRQIVLAQDEHISLVSRDPWNPRWTLFSCSATFERVRYLTVSEENWPCSRLDPDIVHFPEAPNLQQLTICMHRHRPSDFESLWQTEGLFGGRAPYTPLRCQLLRTLEFAFLSGHTSVKGTDLTELSVDCKCSGYKPTISLADVEALTRQHLDFGAPNRKLSSVSIFSYDGNMVYFADPEPDAVYLRMLDLTQELAVHTEAHPDIQPLAEFVHRRRSQRYFPLQELLPQLRSDPMENDWFALGHPCPNW
ncbi:hypothetical protein BKA62DRAFT_787600 [Auriculariales sp. MPI-PUGE-AT-0066]|nr:hypothetical protein BKA62DRAFT_787600 [Auriculariales sp. MPI-PUGE-AT-0066]